MSDALVCPAEGPQKLFKTCIHMPDTTHDSQTDVMSALYSRFYCFYLFVIRIYTLKTMGLMYPQAFYQVKAQKVGNLCI